MYTADVNTTATGRAGGMSGGMTFAPVKGIDPQKLIYVGGAIVALFLFVQLVKGGRK